MTRKKKPTTHWQGYRNPHWLKRDKKKVTILYNFIERRKSFFLRSFFIRMGYNFIDMGDHTKEDILYGKQYGNRMFCNPAYYTGGSLIKNLLRLKKEHNLTSEQIVDRYIFLGGGGQCGPCRYGMYPQEYWKALTDAGFKDFRTLIITTGFSKEDVPLTSAFKFGLNFKINMIFSVLLADLMHIAECALRPYAHDKKKALQTIKKAEKVLSQAFTSRLYLLKIPRALKRVSKMLAGLPRNTKPLPLIFITGEIFANMAHNEANYNLRRFIMDDGCEVLPAQLSQRIIYDFWRQCKVHHHTLKYPKKLSQWLKALFFWLQSFLRGKLVKFLYSYFISCLNPENLGGKAGLLNLDEMARLGKPYYHPEIFGGEGNLEIAEALHFKDTVDGFISIKPFGCIPSSGVSDGVMSKITAQNPQFNFLSIETSGDNEVSILSRVSMLLFKAKQKKLLKHNR